MGLDLDSYSATINTKKLYFQGRYFLGLGHNFIKFSRQTELVAFKNDSLLYGRTKVRLRFCLWMDLVKELV